MTLAAFVKKWNGRKCGSGQCVALARRWIAQLEGSDDGLDTMPTVASAIDFWDAAKPKFWKKVRKTSKNAPPAGALVIFEPTSGNVHGHVAIARGTFGATDDTFDTFDQNYSVPLRSGHTVHSFAGARGWLVFRS